MDEFEFFKGWNGWVLDVERLVLMFSKNCRYEVDLEECINSSRILDRIMQVSRKTWASSDVVSGLVCALHDTLAVQSIFCPCGTSRSVIKNDIRRLVAVNIKSRKRQEIACSGPDIYKDKSGGII